MDVHPVKFNDSVTKDWNRNKNFIKKFHHYFASFTAAVRQIHLYVKYLKFDFKLTSKYINICDHILLKKENTTKPFKLSVCKNSINQPISG